MGLRLPLYPYRVGRGAERRNDPDSPANKRIGARLEELENYLSRDEIKRDAPNIIPIRGEPDVMQSQWVCHGVFDTDYECHTELERLMERVGQHGTIVIPNITHIIGRRDNNERPGPKVKELMKKIHLEDIEVLSLAFKLNGRQHDLYKKYVKPGIVDPEFFYLASRMARATVEYLNRHVGSGGGLRFPAGKKALGRIRKRA
jgi:hypothetical protein